MTDQCFAPAKVNLFLHVGPVAADGYHPVCSLMVFADVGDVVRLEDASALSFRIEGDFAVGLVAETDNLVIRARDRLLAPLGQTTASFELVLEKHLPIAAGLGGGSSDAAAALVLIVRRLAAAGVQAPQDLLAKVARELGADVTACVAAASVVGRGRGDEIEAAPPMPVLPAVLVNPRAPSATGAVYRAFDDGPAGAGADEPFWPDAFDSIAGVVAFLSTTRNDLEPPAVKLQPMIAEVLSSLAEAPETLIARMSGSGATCFALTEDAKAADALARRIADAHPDWWVRSCQLGVARR